MKRNTAFILFAIVVLAVCILAGTWLLRFVQARKEEHIARASSDAKKLTERVRLAGDSWVGYVVMRSPEFRSLLEGDGIGLDYKDDNANYPERMAKLAAGDYDVVVATLDSYLLNAQKQQYPGVIAFVIDESKGGDGIVAVQSIKALPGLAGPGVKIALTPSSPSDFLLAAVASHFDLASLKGPGPWRRETNGSTAALSELKAGNVQAAVLWEPDLSQALEDPRFHKLLSTEKTEGLILDICVLRRQFVVERPQVAEAFVRHYFQALRVQLANEDKFADLAASDAHVNRAKAAKMLAGVQFATLSRNSRHWFGVEPGVAAGAAQLPQSIKATVDVLLETKRLTEDPLQGDFRQIINSSLVETVMRDGGKKLPTGDVFKGGDGVLDPAVTPDAGIAFPKLTPEQWDRLEVVGTIKVRPVLFQAGTSFLSLEGKESIDRMAEDLKLYPSYRLLVRGHTTMDGDAEENKELSRQRAEAVGTYLTRVHDVSENRLRIEGVGGTMPLPKDDGESDRRWKGRLPRVEVLLVENPGS